MIDPSSFLLGMLFAFIASAGIVGAIVWWDTRRKRLSAYEQFEHVQATADEVLYKGIQWTPEQLASIQRANAYRGGAK